VELRPILLRNNSILEALGQLGAAVKDHLISATKSGHFAARSRAIALLVPHLPDDDLFNMRHIFHDRSQETIKTYLSSLLDRDVLRTQLMLIGEKQLREKPVNAIRRLAKRFFERRVAEDDIAFASNLLAKKMEDYYAWWAEDKGLKVNMLNLVVQYFPQHEQTWDLITQRARDDQNSAMRRTVLQLLTTRYELDQRSRIILSRDLNGFAPYIDPSEPISRDVVINHAARSKALIPTPTGCCRWC
jgi:hypothetical protein